MKIRLQARLKDNMSTPKYNKAPVINEDCLILTDMHHPYQDDVFIDECIELAKAVGVNAVYLGGDTFDMNEASAYSDNPPEKLIDELREWRKTDEKLSVFSRRVFGIGNHEDRIARNRKLSTVDFVRLLVGEEWEVSPYYYAKIHGVWVGHPTSAAVEAHTKISIAEDSNVAIGHTHHFAMRQSPDGKKLAMQTGCVADPEKLKYGNINNAGSQKQVQGAIIIVKIDGKVTMMPINKFFPATFWRRLIGY